VDNFEVIKQFVFCNFLFDESRGLHEDTSFLENGLIDSTGIMEMVAFIEKTFDLTVEDEELVPENFDSIRKVSDFIRRKRNGNR
jgi:acyl carrier protein